MKHIFAVLVMVVLASISTCAIAERSDGFFFVQIADTQLGFTNANCDMDPEIKNFEAAVEHINRLRPAFVIISGDFVNAPHDTKQIRAFWRVAKKIRPGIPLYLVAGNHDIGATTADNIRSYKKLFGDDYYAFSYQGSEFIILNSNLVYDPSADAELRNVQRKWFEERLAAARANNAQHIFVCTHESWFLKDPTEADEYFNVPLTLRKDYLDLMKRHGVDYALAGHYHREAFGRDGALEMVTTGSLGRQLGNDPVGFRVVRVYKDRVDHRYYTLDAVPERIDMSSKSFADKKNN